MIPTIFRRDLRGRFVSHREASSQWDASLRMAPARNALHQLERQLGGMARFTGGGAYNPDRPSGFHALTVHGRRVPEDVSPEEALAMLDRAAGERSAEVSVFTDARDRGEAWAENIGAFALWDAHPLSEGHSLVCPTREVTRLDQLTGDERSQVWALVQEVKDALRETRPTMTGSRIMINEGTVSEGGPQHIAHLHVHVIPWYPGMRP